jgi:MinD-like ATPase involved in chromosome partitioning or flagellar assembly
VIIAVGSGKGAPGATTLSVLLGLVWSGERLVCELDPAGADLPYRLLGASRQPLAASPSIATLAVESRPGADARSPYLYAQPTVAGVAVIPGAGSPSRFTRLVPHVPAIGATLGAWSGIAFADLGRLHAANPALGVARSAVVTLLVSRTDVAALAHLRDQVEELAAHVGGAHRLRVPLALVVRADRRDTDSAINRARAVLESIGSPVPVLGAVPDDAAAIQAIESGSGGRRALKGPVVDSVQGIAARLQTSWPEVTEPPPTVAATAPSVARPSVVLK